VQLQHEAAVGMTAFTQLHGQLDPPFERTVWKLKPVNAPGFSGARRGPLAVNHNRGAVQFNGRHSGATPGRATTTIS
jgi:hypothetical protein